jgi:cytochrome c peroxidase
MEAKQAVIGILLLFTGCSQREAVVEARARGAIYDWTVPLGLPPLPPEARVNTTRETVALGERLFHEKRLSKDNTVACATCHRPDTEFAERQRVSIGVQGAPGRRNAPSAWNAVYAAALFWDGRAANLEQQALGPMESAAEMNQPHLVSIRKLAADSSYAAQFDAAFGPGGITKERILAAIAAYERTLLSGNSAFDRFFFGKDDGKDDGAWNESARRGWDVFRTKGRCVLCHTVAANGALFTDGLFHNLGVGLDAEGNLRDLGRYEVTKRDGDQGAFKTPSLRNVARTAPYMHDGSLKSLREVVDFYVGGGNANDWLDARLQPLDLSGREREDLVRFLESLTGSAR